MKDQHDTKTQELPGISATVTKKRGRPSTGKAMTAAQRKAEQRTRDKERVLDTDRPVSDWTKKDCLVVLNNPRSTLDMQRIAVRQLGVLFGDSH